MIKILIVVAILCLATSAFAKEQCVVKSKHLSGLDIETLKEAKQLLVEVDTESLPQAISKIEKTKYPQMTIQMRQAMARTYVDIVKELKVEGQSKREWLYSMVTLNMAYLQFGGGQEAKPLNKLILRKLKKYLPSDILTQPGFQCSLG